jgi:hypothetical protein
MDRREPGNLHCVEHAQHIQLSFLRQVGGVGEYGE